MRKLFFFSIGLILAAGIVIMLSDEEAQSRRFKRPPKLRSTIIFPKAEGSEHLGVSFSHTSHFRFLESKNCHDCHDDKMFAEAQEMNSNKITMDAIYAGKFCGHCHNGKSKTKDGKRTIFAPKDGSTPQCVYCHSVKLRKPEKK